MKSTTIMKIGTGLCAVMIAIGGMSTHHAFAASVNAGAEASFSTSFGKWIDQWTNSWRGWYTAKPVIKDIDPEAGPLGTTVTLTGKKFTDGSVIHFGPGVIKDVTVGDDGDSLSFVVPHELDRYCLTQRFCDDAKIDVKADDYRITVQNGYRFSNAVTFEVTDVEDPSSDGPLTIVGIDGPTSLELGAEGTWTIDVSHEDDSSLKYSVKWGDEGNILMRLFANDTKMQSSATFTHTYREAGTYQPEFTVLDSEGNTVMKRSEKIVIADSSEVPRITSVAPHKAAAGTEVTIKGSGFDEGSTVSIGSMRGEDVTVKNGTTLTFTVPKIDAGVHTVTVSDNDGTSNEIDLTVIAAAKGSLSINGIEAPTRLAVGEVGTWTVDATTNLSGALKYSVDWGAGAMKARGLKVLDTVTQASATFTHAYDVAGTFKPKFTVTDEQGNTESVGASVMVTTH